MAIQVDNSFVRDYVDDFKHIFQRRGGILRPTVRTKTNVIGYSTTFQRIGKGSASSKARHGVITPMNQDHDPIECVLSDKYAGDYVDRLDELKIQHSERQAILEGGLFACGRTIDDQIIVAMDATSQTAVTFDETSEATVRNSLIGVAKALNANEVPNDGKRFAALTANAWAMAETVEEFGSADFVMPDGRPFSEGAPFPMFRRWLGILWTNHQGLPAAGAASGAKGFAWHSDAVGYGLGAEITADISWVGPRAAHWLMHYFSGGACLIDDTGVIEIDIGDDTTVLPTT